jgi:porphobilinogen synthase
MSALGLSGFSRAHPSRLRATPALRAIGSETRVHPNELVLPLFVKEGLSEPRPVASMPGVVQHSLDSVRRAVTEAAEAGVGGVMLFGVPEARDAVGSGATDPAGILAVATRAVVAEVGDSIVVQTDLCLDEYTDHGHCGVLDDRGRIDTEATLDRYRAMAVVHAESGSQLLGLSGMVDGQVAAVRDELDSNGFAATAILAYSAKYATALYGPFRDAVESTLRGNRRSYQLDPANRREGVRQAAIDSAEGADIVMVKPASPYLDVLSDVASMSEVPVWAYQVSGEYAMVEAAAAAGFIDRERAIHESIVCIRRAGAAVVLSYWAVEVADALRLGAFN